MGLHSNNQNNTSPNLPSDLDTQPPVPLQPKSSKKLIAFMLVLVLLLSVALVIFVLRTPASAPAKDSQTNTTL